MPRIQSPILIGGVPRSGTTLFRAMLNAHPHIHSGPERKLFAPLVRSQQSWWEVFGPSLQGANVDRATLDAAAGAYLRTLLQRTTPPGQRPTEKTPNILLFANELARMLPDATFIHVVRDGRAVAASLVRQEWVDPKTGQRLAFTQSIEAAIRYWKQYLLQVTPQLAALRGRCIEVRYERLVRTPEAELRRVLDFLREPWDPAVLQHHLHDTHLPTTEASSEAVAQPLHENALSAWSRRVSAAELDQMEAIAGPVLRALGYDPVQMGA